MITKIYEDPFGDTHNGVALWKLVFFGEFLCFKTSRTRYKIVVCGGVF